MSKSPLNVLKAISKYRILFLDLPIVPGINQAPFWLLWVSAIGLALSPLLLLTLSIFSIEEVIDLITISQLFLIVPFCRKTQLSEFSYKFAFVFLSLYSVSILLDLFYPQFKTLLGIDSRGLGSARFSFLSGEPSFFAEIVVALFILLFSNRKVFLSVCLLIFCFSFSQSKTIIQNGVLFLAIFAIFKLILNTKYFLFSGRTMFMLHGFYVSSLIYILTTAPVFDATVMLHQSLNSWRGVSNALAISLSDFSLNFDYRAMVYAEGLESVAWMKYAVWSFLPFLLVKYSFYSLAIYLIFLYFVFSEKLYKLNALLCTIHIYFPICLIYTSPKWNLLQVLACVVVINSSEFYRAKYSR